MCVLNVSVLALLINTVLLLKLCGGEGGLIAWFLSAIELLRGTVSAIVLL